MLRLTLFSVLCAANTSALMSAQQLPVFFMPNVGQTADEVLYAAQGPHLQALFLRDAVMFKTDSAHFGVRFLGSNADVKLTGVSRQPGTANFLTGSAGSWHVNVPTFSALEYRSLYPGVTLRYTGVISTLKSEFVVEPGGDPGSIRMQYTGHGRVDLSAKGELILTEGVSVLTEEAPFAYQLIDGRRVVVPAAYLVHGNVIRVSVGGYDPRQTLIIDPIISYSSYFGGSGTTSIQGVAVDSTGEAYIAGWTTSPHLPTEGAVQAQMVGSTNAFIAKLDLANGTLVYATFLGGSTDDRAMAIAIDKNGEAYVTGVTQSADFPLLNPMSSNLAAGGSAFVSKLSASGDSLIYSTFLGGTRYDAASAIAVDSTANAVVVGTTESQDFPILNAVQSSLLGAQNTFVTKLSSAGNLEYSTYYGGHGSDEALAVTIDGLGNALFTGKTTSPDWPIVNTAAHGQANSANVFVTKFSATGSVVYSSTFGGPTATIPVQQGTGIVTDAAGNAYVTGVTSSPAFETTPASLEPSAPGILGLNIHSFVLKLDPTANVIYSTYLGGSGDDLATSIVLDGAANTYIVGCTSSWDFPVVNGVQATLVGTYNAFVFSTNDTGNAVLLSTYVGGTGSDCATAAALDAFGNIVIVGSTSSLGFPIVDGYQSSPSGSVNGFVTKISGSTQSVVAAPTFGPAGGIYATAQTVTINTSTAGATIRYTTNGTAPSETLGTVYSGPFAVSSTETINAIAYLSGWADSTVASASFSVSGIVAAPTLGPAGGTYATAQSVTISTATAGATIRYTTNGTTPSETVGTLYSGPFTVSSTETINAIAYLTGSTDSAVSSASYTISSANGSWYSTSWNDRKLITLAHAKVSGGANLTNFPVLVSLASDANLAGTALPGGTDIVFTASDGMTLLNYEIESFNKSTGQLIAWVQIPVLSAGADTTIYMYYGNASPPAPPASGPTWDSNYQFVFHMKESSGTTLGDSTSNANNATKKGTSDPAFNPTGQIGGAQTFVSTPNSTNNDYATFHSATAATNTWTFEFWSNQTVTNNEDIVMETATDGNQSVYFYWYPSNAISLREGYSPSNLEVVPLNGWHHVVLVKNGAVTPYVDGVAGNAATVNNNTDSFTGLGFSGGASSVLDSIAGTLDEVRLSNSNRSAGWIGTEFNNQSSPATFLSVGGQQTNSGGGGTVTITVTSAPVGLAVTVDGVFCAATPCSYQWTPGSPHTLAAATQMGGAGTQYAFGSWAGGAESPDQVTGPSTATTYTAAFTTQYLLTTSASPSNEGSVTPATQYFNAGSQVMITATALTGNQFVNFTGTTNSSTNPLTVTMNGPVTETANFGAGAVSITVTSVPVGLTVTVDGASCAATPCTYQWTPGSPHTLAAATQMGGAGTQYAFGSWTGGAVSPDQVTAPSTATTYTATFTTTYLLTTAASPSSEGSITPSTQYFAAGSQVAITATALTGNHFINFTGTTVSSASPVTLTMNGPVSETGNFGAGTVTITMTSAPPGLTVTVDNVACAATPCSYQWTPSSPHTLVAATQMGGAGTQYVFGSWTGGAGSPDQVTAPSTATTYTATFTTQYLLTTMASPSSEGSITPPTQYFAAGSQVVVTATALSGNQFASFTGTANITTNPLAVTMNAPMTETANFGPISGQPGWYDTSWSGRKPITLAHAKVSGGSNLTNFPVLISLLSDANLASTAQPSGNDILFTDSSGTTKLTHEIEEYVSSTGQLVAWVQIPSLSPTADMVLYMYYGNTAAVNQQNVTGVWDSNYVGVWHMADDASSTTVRESTSKGNSGTSQANTNTKSVPGRIGNALAYNGTSDYITLPNTPSLNTTGSITVSMWINTTGNDFVLLGGYDDGGLYAGYGIGLGLVNANHIEYWSPAVGAWVDSTGVGYNDGNWHYVVLSINGSSVSFYKDGTADGSPGAYDPTGYLGVRAIGSLSNGSGFFIKGIVDDVRVSSTALSAAWIATEYNNQSSPSTFTAVGTAQRTSSSQLKAPVIPGFPSDRIGQLAHGKP